MIGPQYHDGQFWKFSAIAADGSPNNFDTPVVPVFSADFEVYLLLDNTDKIVQSKSSLSSLMFSLLTSTAQKTVQSNTRDRILVLPSSTTLKSSQLSCKFDGSKDCLYRNGMYLRTDFLWAKAMGFTGPQLADGDGVSVGKK